MKPIIRWPSGRTRSQLLFRKSYKPSLVIRIRPAQRVVLTVRPAQAGRQLNTG